MVNVILRQCLSFGTGTRPFRTCVTLAVCVKWTGIVERLNFLQFTIDHTDAIKHAIYSIGRLHVKNSGDVVSFVDVLLDLDIFNCRKDNLQKANHDFSSG